MRFYKAHSAWFALGLCMFACAPEPATQEQPVVSSPPAASTPRATNTPAPAVTQPASTAPAAPPSTAPLAAGAAAPVKPPAAAAPPSVGLMAGAAAPVTPPAAPPANHEAGHAGAPAPAPGVGQPAAPGAGSGSGAEAFCTKYEMHCHYAQPMRHADKAACMADFNGNPVQQACKNMHLDTAIAGTAAACNGMASDFCFAIHCLHAAGMADPTGTTYCK
jgi:hypothetical protein